MKKKNFVKKISSIFLSLILCFSIFCFFGCDDDDQNNKPLVVISYKPYADANPNSVLNFLGISSNTYGEYIKENIEKLSEAILTKLVANYGQTKISGGFLNLTKAYPDFNNASIANMFVLTVENEENEIIKIAENLSKMLYAKFQSSLTIDSSTYNNCLIVSNSSSINFTSSNTRKYSGNESILYTTDSDNNCIAYIFVGTNIDNIKNTLNSLMCSNFGVIERTYNGLVSNITSDGSSSSFNVKKWNYNLFNSTSSLFYQYNSGNEYLDEYLEKFKYKFAVELVALMLGGADKLPTQVNVPIDHVPQNFKNVGSSTSVSLSSLYSTAINASGEDATKKQETFLEYASFYLDYVGLSDYEIESVYELIKTKVIGDDAFEVEEDNSLKHSLEEIIFSNSDDDNLSILKTLQKEKFKFEPIIQLKRGKIDENSQGDESSQYPSILEDVEINGYIKSIVFMTKSSEELAISPEILFLELNKEKSDENFNYTLGFRSNYNKNEQNVCKGLYDQNINEEFSAGDSLIEINNYLENISLFDSYELASGVGKDEYLQTNSKEMFENECELDANIFYFSGKHEKTLEPGVYDYRTYIEILFMTDPFTLTHVNFRTIAFAY